MKPKTTEEKRKALFVRIHESIPFLEFISDLELCTMTEYEWIIETAEANLDAMTDDEVEEVYEAWC